MYTNFVSEEAGRTGGCSMYGYQPQRNQCFYSRFYSGNMLRRLNEVSEELDSCSECKIGYLILTGEIVVKGESAGGFADIGTRRVFRCDKCKKRQVRVARREYVIIGDDIKTKFTQDTS